MPVIYTYRYNCMNVYIRKKTKKKKTTQKHEPIKMVIIFTTSGKLCV